jgi:hypothetical protein
MFKVGDVVKLKIRDYDYPDRVASKNIFRAKIISINIVLEKYVYNCLVLQSDNHFYLPAGEKFPVSGIKTFEDYFLIDVSCEEEML